MRRLILPLLLLTAAPALAAEKPEAAGQYVDVSPVALPVIANGKLINYVFVAVRLNLASTVDSVAMRSKEPYFRDALVRAAYRTPFTDPKSYVRLNDKAIIAAMTREGARIAGPKRIISVEVMNMTPQRMTGVPRPPS